MATRTPAVPPRRVLDAFGLTGAIERLPGGQGGSVRVGPAVLKPAEDPAEAGWAADLLAGIDEVGFRVARPLGAADGRWVVDGWSATALVPGVTGPAGRWDELLVAAEAFHAALRSAPRPDFLDARSHRWARADRVAWGEADVVPVPGVGPLLDRLRRLLRPVDAPCQPVHGDLAGNVLFAPGLAPAVIDLSPYWRPVAYAHAVVAVDGVLWSGADPSLLRRTGGVADGGVDRAQMLTRALLFRLVTSSEHERETGQSCAEELPAYGAVLDEVERLAR